MVTLVYKLSTIYSLAFKAAVIESAWKSRRPIRHFVVTLRGGLDKERHAFETTGLSTPY